MKARFEYCHYANYSQTCLYISDTSFSRLKSYFFFGLCGVVFFSVSLHGLYALNLTQSGICPSSLAYPHDEHPESSEKEIKKVH